MGIPVDYSAFFFDEFLPINLFRRMTMAIPEQKKSTGANKDVY